MIEMDLTDPRQPPDPKERRRTFRSLKPGECPKGFVVIQAGRDFLDDLFYSARKSWRDALSRILRLKKPHSFVFDAAVEMEVHLVQEERKAVNVIGLLPGRDPKLKDETILVGGHLDHLGIGLNGFIYNGADDNATSAATLLEAARVLVASGFRPSRSVVFCSWAGEEMGLVGSRYYAEHPLYPLQKTAVYLNIDMVGSGDSDLLVGGMWEYGRFYEIVKAGLDPEQVVTALSTGAAQSWVLANRSGRMLANDYPLGFRVALHLKDLGIALDLARSTGAVLPVAALAAQLEAGLLATGHGDEDMSALARTIRSLSGLDAEA